MDGWWPRGVRAQRRGTVDVSGASSRKEGLGASAGFFLGPCHSACRLPSGRGALVGPPWAFTALLTGRPLTPDALFILTHEAALPSCPLHVTEAESWKDVVIRWQALDWCRRDLRFPCGLCEPFVLPEGSLVPKLGHSPSLLTNACKRLCMLVSLPTSPILCIELNRCCCVGQITTVVMP